jgi:hypothetical protein
MVRGDWCSSYCQTESRREVVAREDSNGLVEATNEQLRVVRRNVVGCIEAMYLILPPQPFPTEGGFIAIYAEFIRFSITESILYKPLGGETERLTQLAFDVATDAQRESSLR